jgi:hypothetical protein
LAVDKHSVPFERWKHFGKLAQRVGVIIIEKATGKIIWHLDYNVVAQQHNANELENGNILIFDDGAFRTNDSINFSRVIEVDRNTKEIIWEYRDPQMEAFSLLSWEVLRGLRTATRLLTKLRFSKIGLIYSQHKAPLLVTSKILNLQRYSRTNLMRCFVHTSTLKRRSHGSKINKIQKVVF